MCPMCGGTVNASATECPGCGEPFAPVNGSREPLLPEDAESELIEESVTEVTEEYQLEDSPEMVASATCADCGSQLASDGTCPSCSSSERRSEGDFGCPICGNTEYSIETGDIVSCVECGNVYVRDEFKPAPQSWKWKFWVGLVFVLFGNVVVALGSYIHNAARWSPLGAMYLGYGWMDQLVGAIGVIVFIIGLLLFAWSFKREREVECPLCHVTVRESELIVFEPEEEETMPESAAVETALEEIGEMAECPSCGANVSMFDTSCFNCGTVFDLEIGDEPRADEIEETPAPGTAEPAEYLPASEIDQDEIIMDSLELEAPEDDIQLNGNGFDALSELESSFEFARDEKKMGTSCPTCGATVGRGLDTCPGCGEPIPVKGKKEGA